MSQEQDVLVDGGEEETQDQAVAPRGRPANAVGIMPRDNWLQARSRNLNRAIQTALDNLSADNPALIESTKVLIKQLMTEVDEINILLGK